MVRTKREESGFDGLQIRWNTCSHTFNGVEDAGRIIHCAVGIDSNGEALFTEPPTDAISKAGTYEEYLLAWPDLKVGIRNIYDRPKLHQLLLICNPFVESDISTKRAFLLIRCSVSICLIRAVASGSLAII